MKHVLKPISYLMLMFSLHLSSATKVQAQNQTALTVQYSTSSFPGGYEVSCHNGSNGAIQLITSGGTPPYSYTWSHGASSSEIQNLSAGTYQVQVSDAQGQVITESIELHGPAALQVFALSSNYNGFGTSQSGGSDGFIDLQTLGGTPPYQYQWNNGSVSGKIMDLPAGTYSVSLSDANACTAQLSTQLTEPALLSGSLTLQQGVTCAGGHDGLASANISGGVPPYTYQWEHGGFSAQADELKSGQHTLMVNDANGAALMLSVQVPEPPAISMQAQLSSFPNGYEVSCHDCFNGSIQINAAGGNPPYQYNWSGSANTQGSVLQNLGEGNYDLTISDAAGCVSKHSFLLRAPEREDWTVGGNTNVSSQSKFIGTLDSSSLSFRTQNVERIKLGGLGGIEISDTLILKNFADTGGVVKFLGIDKDGKVFPTEAFNMAGVILNATDNCAPVLGWGKHVTNTPTGPVIDNGEDIFKCPLGGNVGIGTVNPQAKLHVDGDLRIQNDVHTYGVNYHHNSNSTTDVRISTDGSNGYIDFMGNPLNNGKLIFNGFSPYEIWLDGKTTVAGELDACRVVVEHSGWCDYVFADNYRLPELTEVEQFIKENKHLPGIPSEENLRTENLDLGKMQKMQMEKIEELMLYVIKLNKRVNELDDENEYLKSALKK